MRPESDYRVLMSVGYAFERKDDETWRAAIKMIKHYWRLYDRRFEEGELPVLPFPRWWEGPRDEDETFALSTWITEQVSSRPLRRHRPLGSANHHI